MERQNQCTAEACDGGKPVHVKTKKRKPVHVRTTNQDDSKSPEPEERGEDAAGFEEPEDAEAPRTPATRGCTSPRAPRAPLSPMPEMPSSFVVACM